MILYIKTMIDELANQLDASKPAEGIISRFKELIDELNTLDPSGFQPASRYDFVELRRRLRNYAKLEDRQWKLICRYRQGQEDSVLPDELVHAMNAVELSEKLQGWVERGALGNIPIAHGITKEAEELLSRTRTVLDSYVGLEEIATTREFQSIKDAGEYGGAEVAKMSKLFISWSGEISHEIAKYLREWLPEVLPRVSPWVSSEDIAKGSRWFPTLMKELESTGACIICLTRENVDSLWIHYEAGAIAAKTEEAKVLPYLVNLDGSEIKGSPLSQFQWAKSTKDDTWKLVRDINRAMRLGHDEIVLRGHFDSKWTQLKRKLDKFDEDQEKQPDGSTKKGKPEPTPPSRTYDDNDLLSILETWMGKRGVEANLQVIFHDDVDKELAIPSGSSQRLLEQAAKRWEYMVARKGANSITFRERPPEGPAYSNPGW
jgi:hypothetical protein